MLRRKLQAGRGRKIIAFAVFVALFGVVLIIWKKLIDAELNPLVGSQRLAFLAAAFSVTAYNLRTRVIDLVMKLGGNVRDVTRATTTARKCGKKLTNLIFLFTTTAVLMAAGGYIPICAAVAKWYGAFNLALFGSASTQFVYILFAFERLERFILDDVEDQARKREAAETLNE